MKSKLYVLPRDDCCIRHAWCLALITSAIILWLKGKQPETEQRKQHNRYSLDHILYSYHLESLFQTVSSKDIYKTLWLCL